MKRRKNLCTGYWKRRAGGSSLQGALLYYSLVKYVRDKKSKQRLSRLWYLRSKRVKWK